MSNARKRLEDLKTATDNALKFAPITTRATAEFLTKPLFLLLAELIDELEKLKGGGNG